MAVSASHVLNIIIKASIGNFAKNMDKTTKMMTKAGKKASNLGVRIGASTEEMKKMATQLRRVQKMVLALGLAFLFSGIALKKLATDALRAMINTWSEAMEGTTQYNQTLGRLRASFQFLKFAIADAFLSSSLGQALIEMLIGLFDWVSAVNPETLKWVFVLTLVALAVGAVLLVLGQFLLFGLGLIAFLTFLVVNWSEMRTALGLLKLAFQSILNPLTLFKTGIGLGKKGSAKFLGIIKLILGPFRALKKLFMTITNPVKLYRLAVLGAKNVIKKTTTALKFLGRQLTLAQMKVNILRIGTIAWTVVTKAARIAMIALNIVMRLSFLGLLISVIAFIVILITKNKSLKETFIIVFNAIKDVVKKVVSFVLDKVGAMINLVKKGIEWISKFRKKKEEAGDIETGEESNGGVTPLATGGIVTSPTRALIGEAGPEAVIPLSGGFGAIGTVNVNVSVGGSSASAEEIGDSVVGAIQSELSRRGIGAGL